MTEHLAAAVRDLASKQVSFSVAHDGPNGQVTLSLSADQVLRYAADPVGYLAEHYGVSVNDYLEWHRSGYSVRCSGYVKKGVRCKATVPGLSRLTDPSEWAFGQGGFCSIHR